MNLILLGPQGSGKGTQAKLLAEKYNLEHLNMGEVLRQIAKSDNPLGKKIGEMHDAGILIPSDMLRKILQLEVNSLNREKNLIFDGVPRKMDQAMYFEDVLSESGRKVSHLIYIKVSEEESIERITKRWQCEKCKKVLIMGKDVQSPEDQCPECEARIVQRADDTLEGIKKRLDIFEKETVPVIKYYKEKGKVIEINGEQIMEKVFQDICKKIDDHD